MKRRFIALTIGGAVLLSACNSGGSTTSSQQTTQSQQPTTATEMSPSPDTMSMAPSASSSAAVMSDASSMTPACDLRVGLGSLLAEHTMIAAQAMQQGLVGPKDAFTATTAQLDMNTVALGAAIKSVYGADAETKFLELWRAHIGFFVDYVTATAKDDAAAKTKAKADLDGYRTDFDAFLTGANPNLPAGSVAEALKAHVAGLIGQFDAFVAKDYATANADIDKGFMHAGMLGGTIAEAIVKQFPDKFGS
jgi:hypothetical protein